MIGNEISQKVNTHFSTQKSTKVHHQKGKKVAEKYDFPYNMSMPKQKKALLMTATGSYNLGDELILQEEYRFLKDHYEDTVSFRVFTHDPKSAFLMDPKTSFVTYFPHNLWRNPLANIGYLIKNIYLIVKADILIIG